MNKQYPRSQKIYCILLSPKERKVALSNKVLEYKKNLIKNQIKESNSNIEFVDGKEFADLSNSVKDFDAIYPGVGENMSFIKRIINTNGLKINYLVREEDKFCWQFSNKGYFNFKSNIPKILSKFKLI